ncbi:hypothetical protein PGB90_010611 [Kerria lacca]
MWDEYESWLRIPNLPRTETGKIKKASPSKIAEWVSTTWGKISENLIRVLCKKCCVTNNLDGIEDDVV